MTSTLKKHTRFEKYFLETKKIFLDYCKYHEFIILYDERIDLKFMENLNRLIGNEHLLKFTYSGVEHNYHDLLFLSISNYDDLKKTVEIKSKYPFMPIFVWLSSTVVPEINIDLLYDKGIDFVINPKMFNIKKRDSDEYYRNLYYFIKNLHIKLTKAKVLKWFYEKTELIKLNLQENTCYINHPGIPIIVNQNIRNRIQQKLDVAFGQLRKPNSSFDSKYELINNIFAFLSYWGILNEVMNDWYNFSDTTDLTKKELPAGYIFKLIMRNSKWNQPFELLKSTKNKKYFVHEFNTQLNGEKHKTKYFNTYPSTYVPPILSVLEINVKDFETLNAYRNKLPIIHDEIKSIKKLKIVDADFSKLNILFVFLCKLFNIKWDDNIAEQNHRIFCAALNYYEGRYPLRFIGVFENFKNTSKTKDPFLKIQLKTESNERFYFGFDTNKKETIDEYRNKKVEIFASVRTNEKELITNLYCEEMFLKEEDL